MHHQLLRIPDKTNVAVTVVIIEEIWACMFDDLLSMWVGPVIRMVTKSVICIFRQGRSTCEEF